MHAEIKGYTDKLRNVVPRQGTETKTPTTDQLVVNLLRNVVPRQGTETMLMLQ